ncbi:MAG: T9SS type A sorting domain-containing protein [Bacteroidetes bacterium]|nr:T9SS type A sorting domain-containing protein [Bacteroidota bacterium]
MKKRKNLLRLGIIAIFCLTTGFTKAQSFPYDSTMFNIGDLCNPNATFIEIQQKAQTYFDTHPELDSVNPMLKKSYKQWETFWQNRAVYIKGDTIIDKLGEVANAIGSLDYAISPTINKKWIQITPDKDDYQDLGVVTCIWSKPGDLNYILVGTESSGLWKTIDGGLNWYNITDSYTGQNANSTGFFYHYPFGVKSIAVSPFTYDTILIACTIPFGFNDLNSNGFGIIKSIDGGSTWTKTSLFNSSDPNNYDLGLNAGIIKIMFDPISPNWVLALSRSKLYISNNLFANFTITVKLDNTLTNSPLSSTGSDYKNLNLRDIEVLEITQTSSTFDRKILISTDSYNGISAQLLVAQLPDYTSNSWTWTIITNLLSHNNYKDVIAISVDDHSFGPSNNLYVAYNINEVQVGNPSNNKKFVVDHLISINYSSIQNYNNYWLYHDDKLTSPCAGFGNYYDSFDWIYPDLKFVIGGYGITVLMAEDSKSSNEFDYYKTYNYTTPHLPLLPPNDENSGKNRTMHYGVKGIFSAVGNPNNYNINRYITYVATEGGITKINHDANTICKIKNINGKGLAIQQFNDIASTKNNEADVLVGGTMHNGYWGRKATNANWENYWLDDGGKVVINDTLPNFLYGVTYSTWSLIEPENIAVQGGKFIRSNQGLTLNTTIIPHIFPYTENTVGQINPLDPIANIPPLIVDQTTKNILYLGGHNVYKSADNGTNWSPISGLPSNVHANALKVIVQSPSNPDIMYASFENPTWCRDYLDLTTFTTTATFTYWPNNCYKTETHKLYKKTSVIWNDITQNVGCQNALSWTAINDILINPTKPSEVWTVQGGAWNLNGWNTNQGRNRVLFSSDGGSLNSWTDISTGLSCLSVNCIRFIKNENNADDYMLIVGTDAGVYYRNKGDAQWTAYRDGMPLAIVTDIEVYEKGKKIRAATFGRGIWEAEIPCFNESAAYTTINTTPLYWNTNQLSSGIHILPGKTLTITSNVRFSNGATVIIDEGAKLIVNGGTLEACPGEMWGGVRIQGSMEIDPENFIESNHAIIQIKNYGTIKDAEIAIKDIGGGVIYMDSANFINNRIAVQMNEYTYRPEKSYFQNSYFKTNSLFHDPVNYPFQYFVELNGVYKLNILGCKFENQIPVGINNNWATNGIGIKSYNSVYNVCDRCNNPIILPENTPCPQEYYSDSKFINLDYGLYAFATNTFWNFNTKNTTFDNNNRGIYAMNIYNASFTLNTFKVPLIPLQPYNMVSYIGAYGMYLMNCNNYTVESNIFDKADNYPMVSVGIIINSSGSAYNSIYNNKFKNIKFAATLAQDINRDINQNNGLKIKCNDYRNNNQDIAVVDFTGIGGISKIQGANATVNDPLKDQKPAGNTFSQTALISDIDNTLGHNFDYYYHNGITENWVPVYYTNSNVLINKDQFSTYNKSLSCPSIAVTNPYTSNLPGLSTLQQGFTENTLAYNSSKLILQIWLDGGNTEELEQTVELSYPWEAYELFQSLIGLSPYLSEDVLVAAIQNEDGLPPYMLKLVLLANPQSIRSDRVMEALNNRCNPFPPEWIDELMEENNVISPVEDLQADVSYYASLRKTYIDLIKQYYLADTVSDALESFQKLLETETDLNSKYELVFAKLSNNEIVAANELLNNINNIIPNDVERQKYDKLTQIIPIIIQLNYEGLNWEEINQSKIIEFSETNNDLPGGLAKALRLHYDPNYVYQEPIYVNSTQTEYAKPPHSQIKKDNQINKNYFSITPNPASDFIVIQYKSNEVTNDVDLFIYDIQGKLLLEQKLNTKINQDFVDIKKLNNGYYQCKLLVNGKRQFVEKLIIKH